jgi:hypothetical protein
VRAWRFAQTVLGPMRAVGAARASARAVFTAAMSGMVGALLADELLQPRQAGRPAQERI